MTETIAGRRRLGRGLEALLGPTREEAEREGSLVELAIADIRPNPYQPRRDVDPTALDELKASILKAGLLQPVVVRAAPRDRPAGYELIAGERRLRACQALGWERIPAVKRDVDDRTVLTLALIENLQRDDLSPVDEARGYERLIAEFSLAQQDVADAVGRDRSTVANALRLLKLPATVLALLHEGRLSVGHARALLALDDPRAVAAVALRNGEVGGGWHCRPGRPVLLVRRPDHPERHSRAAARSGSRAPQGGEQPRAAVGRCTEPGGGQLPGAAPAAGREGAARKGRRDR